MYGDTRRQLRQTLTEIEDAGLYKRERELASPQSAHITAGSGGRAPGVPVLNFCANNYLGLADHPDVISAARRAS